MLITKSDLISASLELSENITDESINGWIKEVELFDLRQLLNNQSFYTLLIKEANKQPVADAYVKILEPYEYRIGDDFYSHRGLKEVLVYLTYARFIRTGNVKSSPSGLVTKDDINTIPVSQEQLSHLYNMYKKQAHILFNDLEFYLEKFVPEYTKSTPKVDQSSTFNIQKIAGPANNDRYYVDDCLYNRLYYK